MHRPTTVRSSVLRNVAGIDQEATRQCSHVLWNWQIEQHSIRSVPHDASLLTAAHIHAPPVARHQCHCPVILDYLGLKEGTRAGLRQEWMLENEQINDVAAISRPLAFQCHSPGRIQMILITACSCKPWAVCRINSPAAANAVFMSMMYLSLKHIGLLAPCACNPPRDGYRALRICPLTPKTSTTYRLGSPASDWFFSALTCIKLSRSAVQSFVVQSFVVTTL